MSEGKPRRVLHVTDSEQWSGGSAQIIHLAKGLKELGWESVIACRPGGEFRAQAKLAGFPLLELALRQDYDVLSAWRLASWAKRQGISVIHAHHSRSHGICVLSKVFWRAPKLVVSRRVSFAMGKNPFSAWKYRTRLIDRYVAVAAAVKDVLVQGGVAPERVAVIHSGADLDRFAPRSEAPGLRASLGIPDGAPVIGKIANASAWKGQSVFLEAARRVRAARPDVRFLLAGRGTQDDWVRREAEGLGDAAVLAGFREDVPELLSCLSASVNAATGGEGLSGALRESLCMGVPVAASDLAGNRELLGEEGRRYLFSPGDPAALAERLLWILAHQDEARAFARAQRPRLVAEFSIEQNARRTAALYDSLL